MADAAAAFRARLSRLIPGRMQPAVYSPYLGRYFQDGDDLADLLACHLYRPLPFAGAIRRLREQGVKTFLECSVLSGFGHNLAATVPDGIVLHAGLMEQPIAEAAGSVSMIPTKLNNMERLCTPFRLETSPRAMTTNPCEL
jgi:hypothetical protein